jgi:hypothetical protein
LLVGEVKVWRMALFYKWGLRSTPTKPQPA